MGTIPKVVTVTVNEGNELDGEWYIKILSKEHISRTLSKVRKRFRRLPQEERAIRELDALVRERIEGWNLKTGTPFTDEALEIVLEFFLDEISDIVAEAERIAKKAAGEALKNLRTGQDGS